MALPKIQFNRGQGGLGRQLATEDHISGMQFNIANGDLPSGFSASDRYKIIYSVQDAEDLGILDDYSDETKCVDAEVLMTNAGSTGNIVTIVIGTVTVATYTVQLEEGVNDVATGLNTNLNSTTSTHGYTSTVSTATVTIVAPVGYGVYPGTLTITLGAGGGTAAATITQFDNASAEGSFLAIMHYHISEFFRIHSKGILHLSLQSNAVTWDATGITELQNYAEGKIRQIGTFITEIDGSVNAGKTFATSLLDTLQTKADTMETNHKPCSILAAADVKGDALSGVSDFTSLTDNNVTFCMGQDRANYGYLLSLVYGYSISDMGTMLGAISLSKVNQSIGWVDKFNIAQDTVIKTNGANFTLCEGIEHDTAGFATGDRYRDQSASLLEALHAKSQVFQLKHVGITGTYWCDSFTCIAQDNDYAYIENQRTIDKTVRNCRTKLLPYLSGKIYLNTDGTMTSDNVSLYENLCDSALREMEQNGEISQRSVDINNTQDVASTSEIIVVVQIVPVGVARTITVNIGFTANI